MSLPRSPEIAASFKLASKWEDRKPDWPAFAMPKLNGIRCMYVPGVGFFTRDGIPWNDGVLGHIEEACRSQQNWLDGELYAHGLHLQTINGIVAINRSKNNPSPDIGKIQFHVFDLPQHAGGFQIRQDAIRAAFAESNSLQYVPYKEVKCETQAGIAHDVNVSLAYEGTIYCTPGGYSPGKGWHTIKRKAWVDDDFAVLALIKGRDGKYDHSLGAVQCITNNGVIFEVGSFEMTDSQRLEIFYAENKPTKAKVKYRELTKDGAPFNARVLALY
jgi:hypothetical protein